METETASAEILRLLGDQTALPKHPAMFYAGDAAGKGSLTFKIPQVGLGGYKLLTQVAEGAAVADSTLDDASTTLTVAPFRKQYNFSDLAMAVNPNVIDPIKLRDDSVKSAANTLVSLVAALVGGFSQTSGTPGAALTTTNILTAKAALGARSVPGPYLCILSGVQYGHFQSSLASATGSIAWMEATAEQINQYGEGYKGNWGGVDIFLSNRVPTANAGVDHAGGIFGRGAIAWGDSSFIESGDPNLAVIAGKVLFERSRVAQSGETAFTTHANFGVAEAQDLAGQSLITKATA